MTPASVGSMREYLTEILVRYETIQSAALYGSVARGDSEQYSDVDVLLVCQGGHKREIYDEVNEVLSKTFDRLSLSVYSPRELNFLAKAQSLFLLHLKREAVMLFDRTKLLTTLMETFVQKNSYEDDFDGSLKLITPLKTVVQGSPNNFHRLAFMYSLFRVFGVYMLAEHKVYEFSKAKMTECLCRTNANQEANIRLLSELRILNANFFSSGTGVFKCESFENDGSLITLQQYGTALGALIGRPFQISEQPYSKAVEEFLIEARNHVRLGYRLRTWFLLLVYDGLNLYCSQNEIPILESFDIERLIDFSQPYFPVGVRSAASECLEYLRNYPLKYFLLEESKISLAGALTALTGLTKQVKIPCASH